MPQPDDMITRLTRAISKSCFDGCEEHGCIEPCRPDLCTCRRAAVAALEAMREPTPAMLAAPTMENADSAIWSVMIDTALKGA
jgi:hypothetical protein